MQAVEIGNPTVVHYVNLTNGIYCKCPEVTSGQNSVIRLQSTWCEQKRWGDILTTVGADLYYQVASGHRVIVHDVSEKDRMTRACWQGLSWLRVAMAVAWTGECNRAEFSRNNRMDVTRFWLEQWRQLPDRTRTYVQWFGRWHRHSPIALWPCDRQRLLVTGRGEEEGT